MFNTPKMLDKSSAVYFKLSALLCFVNTEILYLAYPLGWENNTWRTKLFPTALICASTFLTVSHTLYLMGVKKYNVFLWTVGNCVLNTLISASVFTSSVLFIMDNKVTPTLPIFFLPQFVSLFGVGLLSFSTVVTIFDYYFQLTPCSAEQYV